MKKIVMPVAVLLTLGLVTSCDENKDEATVVVEEPVVATTPVVVKAGEGKKTIVVKEEVPEPVRTTFEKKYPKANNLTWTSYEPVEADNWDLARKYYYADSVWDDMHYYTWYSDDGAEIKNDVYVKGGEKLPAAVNKAIATNYPGYVVVEVDPENDKDMDMFEVELEKGEAKVKVKYLPDGTVFKLKD